MHIQEINKIISPIFVEMGLPPELGHVTLSDRPDLSDLQCNGALKATKILKRNPRDIAAEIASKLEGHDAFTAISVDGPGFLNISLTDNWIYAQIKKLNTETIKSPEKEKIIIDYGGPNVAKPLHVGHLRSAIIGESIKRIATQLGHDVISDVHLGDWGTPMGMIIAYMSEEYPDWPYFSSEDPSTYPEELPLQVQDLNEMYPLAAKRFKDSEDFADKARTATAKLQSGDPAYKALWQKFVALSLTEIKSDFKMLNVDFDLWLGESDADPYIETMVAELVEKGIAHKSDGALVIDVSLDTDKHEMPPLILQKKDGAATYATTDLATIKMRTKDKLDKILYVVDQRQHMHFTQVFRAAVKAGYIKDGALEHLGFGTMNGLDGKPFKTRQGGVMRLTDLIETSKRLSTLEAGFDPDTLEETHANMITDIATAAIKFGDLVNPRTSDYIFNPNDFIKFEGKTGPYIQYAAVRIKSLLEKSDAQAAPNAVDNFSSDAERKLALKLLNYADVLHASFTKRMPSDLCDYTYGLAQTFSSFYKHCPIASEPNAEIKGTRLLLATKSLDVITQAFSCLAIPVPHKMERGSFKNAEQATA